MKFLEVRRARFGPGLWPGPCRQARRAGGGLQGQRRAGGASRAEQSGSTLPGDGLVFTHAHWPRNRATGTNDFPIVRTCPDSRQGHARGHGLI